MTRADDEPIPLTVLMRAFNEADRIEAAIRSALPLRAEILVIDSGSTDATATIARSLGARVVTNPWAGFGPQRRFGEGECRHDHVFSMDADEVLTPALVREIRALFRPGPPPALAKVRKAMALPHRDRPPPFAFCTEQIYLYDRRVARTIDNPNWDHLEIRTDEAPRRLRAVAWHFTYRDWNHAVAKANYVAELAARTSAPRSRLSLTLRLLVEFPSTFLRFYILRRLFLAGADGFAMATILAFGRFLRIAKMREAKMREAKMRERAPSRAADPAGGATDAQGAAR
ncbi:glycosyl transferase family 2 [Methylobacterium sp. 4-46]|uniref:glycosyltransferase family 2 protein n=1 Tax=unclassified Methylobacterium TaxID=2615210 RepID=UPI000165C6AA|nr:MULTISPECIES: glycosyltransferase family 2 protein [Methylobacterium]ACA17439.1 glycosyl transferase family 2 [Methylobacterium sp. 4-46]WFT83124.1 glycosyltransferase family 2 protein [Methylobacterium nodulans]